MTFTLHVDAARWRAHLGALVKSHRALDVQLAPVIKGNGYGFGRDVLAREAAQLGLQTVAVGTVFEVDLALARFPGTCVVLEPFLPDDGAAVAEWRRVLRVHAERVVVTVAGPHLVQAASAGATRVRLEGATSLRRFGMTSPEMDAALRAQSLRLAVEGLSLHLPIVEPAPAAVAALELPPSAARASGWVRETLGWLGSWRQLAADHGLPLALSVSHISADDVAVLRGLAPDVVLESRVGTALWLGDHDALRVTGTVLAVHEAGLGHERVGYTQVDTHGNQRVIVVSGGTSHGVALAAPASPSTMRRRGIAVAQGISQAVGKVRSPFRHGRTHFTFAEPPHMHVSMLWCEDRSIAVGSELECRVRHTVANFDIVTGLD